MAELIPDFASHDALSLGKLVRDRAITPLELLDTVIERVQSVNGLLNCVCLENYEHARAVAKAMEQQPGSGPFAGLPLFLKDLILQHQGTPFTSGSRYLKDFCPTQTSAVVQKLLDSGMIFTARTVSAEFGALPTVESRYWGTTRNPWNTENSTGGSSGGAAALVASRVFPLADANDGGGSVRGPAALCGLTGLKPSRGRHSFAPFGNWRFGMGVCGCLSLSVRDTAAYLDLINGGGPAENPLPTPAQGFLHALSSRPTRRRIAVLRDETPIPVDAVCREAVEATAALCRDLGHDVVDLPLPQWTHWASAMGQCFQATGAVWLACRITSQAELLGRMPTEEEMEPSTWAALQKGLLISATEHEAQLESMRRLSAEICTTLAPYDAVLTPATAAASFRLGYLNPSKEALPTMAQSQWGLDWLRYGFFITLLNATGQPGISLPLHWTADNQPVGVQLIGRIGEEETLLRLAAELESAHPWMQRLPGVTAR